MKISFENVDSSRMQNLFSEVLDRFEPLHKHHIQLRQKNLDKVTMRAQPMMTSNFFFTGERSYNVDYTARTKIDSALSTSELPKEVLRGWFAHELGHIMDYQKRSWSNLLAFGATYLWSEPGRRTIERMADMYAIKYGFKSEILATQEFILSHVNLNESYRKQIMKYYLSPMEIASIPISREK